MLSVIGKGSYGKVLLVKKNDSGELYAMKVLKKSEILRRNQVEHTMTERRILVSYSKLMMIVGFCKASIHC
jgi:serine/threonine protein kinase